jgi:hypothetical protein
VLLNGILQILKVSFSSGPSASGGSPVEGQEGRGCFRGFEPLVINSDYL